MATSAHPPRRSGPLGISFIDAGSDRDHDDYSGHDHHDHGHGGHDHHDHDDHGHDDHSGHDRDHDDHSGHGHDDHSGHGHDDHGHGGHGHGGHDHHDHSGHAHDFREASRRSLITALALISSYMVAEVVGGVLSGSLALIADAGHMLTDAAAIGLALLAMTLANREASTTRTWGFHRTEVLAAMINALSLWLIAAWIVFEAYERFSAHHDMHIEGGLMMAVGIGGLIVNIIAAYILHASSEHSMNVEGALQHVIADLLGSIGVIISGILIIAFDWTIADPIISVVIALLIVLGSWRLVAQVVHVLLEGSPDRIDMYRLCSEMEEVEGVTIIHDVHCTTITSGYEALTAHVLIDPDHSDNFDDILREMRRIASEDFGIAHVTIQVEQTTADCDEESHHVGHLLARERS